MTLVVPFETSTQGGRSAGGVDTAAAAPAAPAAPAAAAAADAVGFSNYESTLVASNNDNIEAMIRMMDPVSAAAAVAAAEDAARETGLALEHARVTLAAAEKAEATAAKAAAAAEGTATVAHQAAAAAAAAAAEAAATGRSVGERETTYGDSGSVSNGRGDSTTFSGGSERQEAMVGSGAGTLGTAGPKPAGGGTDGTPLQISFLMPPTYGRTAEEIPATSYGSSGDSETLTPAEIETMLGRLSGRRHRRQGHAVDPPSPSIAIPRQPPLSRLDEPQRSRHEQTLRQRRGQGQAKPRLLPHHLATGTPKGNSGGLGRGGWRGGGDAPVTSTASASSSAVAPAPLARATGKVTSAAAGVSSARRLSSTRILGRHEPASWGGGTGGSLSGAAAPPAAEKNVAEGDDAEGRQDEAEWVRSLLFSGPGTPGLVVDLWSPGAIFLRHVEVGLIL